MTLTTFILDHLIEEEEVCQLLDVVVVDAVIPQGVAESPEFGYDISHKSPLSVLTTLMEYFLIPRGKDEQP